MRSCIPMQGPSHLFVPMAAAAASSLIMEGEAWQVASQQSNLGNGSLCRELCSAGCMKCPVWQCQCSPLHLDGKRLHQAVDKSIVYIATLSRPAQQCRMPKMVLGP